MARPTVLVVCCYGVYDPSLRSPTEMQGLDEYLDGVARLAQRYQPHTIVLCGGLTNGPVSEAASMAEPLRQRLERHPQPTPAIKLEEDSINAPQNVQRALDIIEAEDWRDHRIVYVADRVRWLKLLSLCRVLCPADQPYHRVRAVKRTDTHRRSHWWVQAAIALRYLISGRHLQRELAATSIRP